MENFEWEYYDSADSTADYFDSMTEGTFYEDEYYEEQVDLNNWQDYYNEISDEIEY